MNTIKSQAKPSRPEGAIPLPWEVFCEFGRVICLGILAAFGLRRAANLHDRRDVRGRREVSGAVGSTRIPAASRVD